METGRLQDAAEFDEIFPSRFRRSQSRRSCLQNDSDTLVRKALEMLPSTSREVLILRELEGCPTKRLADITGMPIRHRDVELVACARPLRQVLATLMNRDPMASSRRIVDVNA